MGAAKQRRQEFLRWVIETITTMDGECKDLNILRVGILPAFIPAAIVGGIATLSVSISAAVTTNVGARNLERAAIERAMVGSELVA